MANTNTWYFGWFRSQIGPYAAKYDGDVLKPPGSIVTYKLTDDEVTWDINKLIRKYPYKEIT